MTLRAFSHVNINAGDFQRSLRFYADLLGLPVTQRFAERSDTGAMLGLAPPHTNLVATLSSGPGEPAIELIEWRLPTVADRVPADAAGVRAIRVQVPDVERVVALLRDDGYDVAAEQGADVTTVAGPDGTVELVAGDRAALVGATVRVADIDASAAAYAAGLGLAPAPVTTGAAGRRTEVRVVGKRATFVIALEQDDEPVVVVPSRRADSRGYLRLAVLDDDVPAAYERALSAGGTPLTAPALFEFGAVTAHAALWYDVDGVVVEALWFLR
jgi:catechol 2,3-dioxygenase-like lactoylglutathione lyase family enzyme